MMNDMNMLKALEMKWLIMAVLLVAAGPCLAEDRLKLDETAIQGASELPKVLYIVPWKTVTRDNKPVRLKSMLDEVMAPVDREVLDRQIQFYHNRASAKATPTVAASKAVQATDTSAVQK